MNEASRKPAENLILIEFAHFTGNLSYIVPKT